MTVSKRSDAVFACESQLTGGDELAVLDDRFWDEPTLREQIAASVLVAAGLALCLALRHGAALRRRLVAPPKRADG